MLVAALRQRILDLAIRGKLVPQRPEDGTAEELYRQILQEKKKLIAAGKLKKEKPLPPISDDEIPFDIPKSWRWVRLPEVVYNVGDKSNQILAKEVKKEGAYPAISQGQELIDGYTDKTEKVIRDLPLVMFGDHTRNVKFVDFPFVISADGTKFMKAIRIEPKFLYYWMKNAAEYLRNRGYARHFSLLKKELVPLPPLAEQQRIVEKVGALFAELESIERSQEKVAAIQGELNKRILERAIQGKLVPQRPEDGTAEELYQQIQKEKKKLIAAGKLKKEKPLPPITEEEIPFDIPDSWKWVRMGDIFMHNTGKAQNSTAETRNGITRKFITTSNVYWNRFDFTKVKEMLFTEKEIEKCSVQKGDLLVCEGGDCGRAAIWQDGESMCIQNHIHRLRPIVGVEVMFFYYIFWLLKQMGYINGKGVGIKGLSSNTLHKLPCPLPPLAEQERIVKKLELMLPQIGQTTAPTNA